MSGLDKPEEATESAVTKSITPWSAEYFAIIAEIDASIFVLEQMQKRFGNRAPIVQMVDQATGYEESELKEAWQIVARVKELQAKLPPNDPHFVDLSHPPHIKNV